jgi:hypothetical protein
VIKGYNYPEFCHDVSGIFDVRGIMSLHNSVMVRLGFGTWDTEDMMIIVLQEIYRGCIYDF